jgi:spore maturation protein CgeB
VKILYVGHLAPEGTCAMRLAALRSLGLSVTGLDSTPRNGNLGRIAKTGRRCLWHLGWPMDFEGINSALRTRVSDLQPQLVWIDKGLAITADTLRTLRRLRPGIQLVHYNPDDPFGGFGLAGWRTFLRAVCDYDVHFVPRRENVAEYTRLGARRVVQLMPAWGYAPDVHRPVPVDAQDLERYGADIGFVGSFEPERARDLLTVAQAGLNVRIVGPWPAAFLHPSLLHSPQGAFGADYAKAICSFKIALGFLRKRNRDQHTSRSIEIPACGVLMLAERSEEHQQLLTEGREAEFFSSAEELIDKARFYLSHDRERERIAAAGRERCLASGYSNEQRMARMLGLIQDARITAGA